MSVRPALYHIAAAADLRAARDVYAPDAFAREGFIHCSYREQLIDVANRLFRGRTGLVVLEVDPGRVEADVVDENLEGGNRLYPHVYGRLPLAAIVHVHHLPSDEAGRFLLPDSIEGATESK